MSKRREAAKGQSIASHNEWVNILCDCLILLVPVWVRVPMPISLLLYFSFFRFYFLPFTFSFLSFLFFCPGQSGSAQIAAKHIQLWYKLLKIPPTLPCWRWKGTEIKKNGLKRTGKPDENTKSEMVRVNPFFFLYCFFLSFLLSLSLIRSLSLSLSPPFPLSFSLSPPLSLPLCVKSWTSNKLMNID